MRTLLTDDPVVAAHFIRERQTVAFPTETVFGLGANAFDEGAVGQIFRAKGRPSDNPLIVHVADEEQVLELVAGLNAHAEALMHRFFPGPLTLVLPRSKRVPDVVTAGLGTVGIRMPDHDLARAFIRLTGTAVAAPSANRSGRPSPTTWEAVRDDLHGRIPCILMGEPTLAGLESSVVDCTGPYPLLLRAGALPLEVLQQVIPETVAPAVAADFARRSPGTRHRHYAPRIPVHLVDTPAEIVPGVPFAWIGLDKPQSIEPVLMVLPPDAQAYARNLFHFLRQAEATDARVVYCQRVPPVGIGRALMDRLNRASEGSR